MSTILGALSLFLASFITARIVNKNGLLVGFIIGIMTSVLVFLITLFSTGVIFNIGTITKILIITLTSSLGGIFGVNSKD